MTSYSHDAEVIVYNYKSRTPSIIGSPDQLGPGDPMDTEEISLREAIVSISCTKTKSSPEGTFSIVLKPTKEWMKILVPSSWCSIWMSTSSLSKIDLTGEISVPYTRAPLKMIGMIMAIRVNKEVSSDGTSTLTYHVMGYDFGYILTAGVYVNFFIRDMYQNNTILPQIMASVGYANGTTTYGNPAKCLKWLLDCWSTISSGGLPGLISMDNFQPPSIRLVIPEPVMSLVGMYDGVEALQFLSVGIGIDERRRKVLNTSMDGKLSDFSPELLGEKRFMLNDLIMHNTLWGMIQEYLNPILNEAYCDLHLVQHPFIPNWVRVKPVLIMRQIPFNTDMYDALWASSNITGNKYKVTNLVNLPATILSASKIISYDVGYSEYERVNMSEISGNVVDGPQSGQVAASFNTAFKTAFDKGSIMRMGLRPRVHHGVDYGVASSQIEQAGYWKPLLMDWWFSSSRFMNGTIESVGLDVHIAIGENVMVREEKLLAHIESYTHTFTVDSSGVKKYRTTIEFIKGVSSDSFASSFKYLYGSALGTFGPTVPSSFEDDVESRSTYTETNPQSDGPAISQTTELSASNDYPVA